MKLSKAVGASVLAAALSATGGAQAATELVNNGTFTSVSSCFFGSCGTATGWTDDSVTFSAGVANFNHVNDWMSQSFTTLFAAGTSFVGSFFYDKANTSGGTNNTLTYLLQTSATQNFSGPVTTLGSATLNNSQLDGTVSFGSFSLANQGYVRIYFDSQSSSRSFAVGNVSVLATDPVPEPETYAMFLAGLAAVGFIARRRRPQA